MIELNNQEAEAVSGGCLPFPTPTPELLRRAAEVIKDALEKLEELLD